MRLLFVAGGTGGHINPAVAVANEIKRTNPDAEILFVGTEGRMETKIVPNAGFEIKTVKMNGFNRSKSFRAIKDNIETVVLTLKASKEAKKIISEFNPDVVVGFGGYVTGPVVRTAHKMGIKTAIHEQNSFPGVANKALAKIVDKVMLTNEDAEKHLDCKNIPVITGLPIRSEILRTDKDHARILLGVNDDEMLVLSMGGSLGADAINNAFVDMMKILQGEKNIRFIHATGQYGTWVGDKLIENNIPYGVLTNIDLREYIENMDVCLPGADLVISRAGASSLSEISALKKPSILIPSPNVAENHQYHNAMSLAQNGGAILIEEKDLTGEYLAQVVMELKNNRKSLNEIGELAGENARINALSDICKIILSL